MHAKRRLNKTLFLGVTLLLSAFLVAGVGIGVAQAQGPYNGAPGGPFGGMMGGCGGGGMMGGSGWGQPYNGSGTPISIDQATQTVQNYVAARGNPDLAVTEVLEFQRNFYAMVKEKSAGANAFELLVNKNSGAVYPEMGPNMVWNTKYGMMGGMMGGYNGSGTPTAQMPVTAQQAQQIAQEYLDQYLPGTTTEDPDAFYGYYTVHTVRDGKVSGMLSVNGYSGSVWYHTWHGAFLQEKKLAS